MKLTRLRVEQFRQFRAPLEIGGFEPGLNLFVGPNEAGKSTLVAAIRAAFFERHRSRSVDDLQPWGDGAAAPAVELEFDVGSHRYRLVKRFLHRARCELQIGAQRLDGAEAEDHLAELFGFHFAGRGASDASHWGIPGLLWMTQGSAHQLAAPVSHAAAHLDRALGESLGEVASSRGDRVLARVEAARNELLTAATGAPRGAYAEALKQLAALKDKRSALEADIAAYRAQVDTLLALRREHAADAAEQPWQSFRAQQQAAAERLAQVSQVEEALRQARQQAEQAEARLALLRRHLDAYQREEDEARRRAAVVLAAQTARYSAEAPLPALQRSHQDAVQRSDAARAQLREARQQHQRQQLLTQQAEMQAQVAASAARLTDAESADAALCQLTAQAAATPLSDKKLAELRRLQSQLDATRIRQSAAATRLEFELEAGRSLSIGAEQFSGRGEVRLAHATDIVLPGLGRLRVQPGGSDLAALESAALEQAELLNAQLQKLGLDSLAAAEARHLTNRQLDVERQTAAARLQSFAPAGLEALRAEHALLAARLAEVERSLAALPALADTPPLDIAAAEDAEESARRELANLAERLAQARLAAADASAACAAAEREAAAAQAQVDAPGRADNLSQARADLTDTLAVHGTLAQRVGELSRQVEQAQPELLRQDVERYRRSADLHEQRHAERRDALLRLEAELQASGALGLDEAHAAIERDLAQAQRRHGELARRAAALDHLLRLLRAKRRALTRRLQAPLQKHLDRYLNLLFPGASVEIDESLQPGPLTRPLAARGQPQGQETGRLEALSFGAREQMGVVSRLAYADLLREAGRPTLLILDDALVHSDAERLAQMKRILFDAAQRHQILLFTCHPEKWRDLGVAPRSLETLRGVPAPIGVAP